MALSDRDVSDHQWLIDPATGVLHLWSEDVGLDGDDRVDADSFEETGLQAIEPIASRDRYRVMADFADQLSDTFAQAELSIALRGRGALRRFRDVLHERHVELVGLGVRTSRPAVTISRSTGSAARAWSTRAQPQTSSTLIRHRLSHECHVYPEMLARSAPMPSRADLATTADSAGTRAEQRVSALTRGQRRSSR